MERRLKLLVRAQGLGWLVGNEGMEQTVKTAT